MTLSMCIGSIKSIQVKELCDMSPEVGGDFWCAFLDITDAYGERLRVQVSGEQALIRKFLALEHLPPEAGESSAEKCEVD